MAPGNRHLLGRVRQLLGVGPSEAKEESLSDFKEQADLPRCPKCGSIVVLVEMIKPKSRLPP